MCFALEMIRNLWEGDNETDRNEGEDGGRRGASEMVRLGHHVERGENSRWWAGKCVCKAQIRAPLFS